MKRPKLQDFGSAEPAGPVSPGMELRWVPWFFLWTSGVMAAWSEVPPSGGGSVEARSESGLLKMVEARWAPEPLAEGRWWWLADGGGSAWIRAGGLQVGPLGPRRSAEGERAWGPGDDLSSGHWGVDVDLGPVAGWAVQDPDRLEVGALARGSLGAATVAWEADRSWTLALPDDQGPWVDRTKVGLRWDCRDLRAGVEAGLSGAPAGPLGWTARQRCLIEGGDWSVSTRGQALGSAGVLSDWTSHLSGAWGPWSGTWSDQDGDEAGRVEGAWMVEDGGVDLSWGPRAGPAAGAHWRSRFPGGSGFIGATWGPQTAVTGRLSATGRWEDGTWSAAWEVGPDWDPFDQVLLLSWRHPKFEVGGRWKTEGTRLGWVGPGTSFALTLKWLF